MIKIYSDTRYKIPRAELKQKLTGELEKRNLKTDLVLNLVFVGRRKMKQIALKYKHENIALPVLSFSYLDDLENTKLPNEESLIGEIFICYPQAVLLAAEREKKVDYTLFKLVQHGIENILG